MNTQPTRLLLASLALAWAGTGYAQTTYVDDPTDLTWYAGRTGNTATANIPAGSVLFTTAGTSGVHFLANFPTATLSNVGDTLQLTAAFTLGTIATPTNSFRFGLHNSGATQVAANFNSATNSAFTDDYGYLVNGNFDGTSAGLWTRSGTANNALLGSTAVSSAYVNLATTNSGTLAAFTSGESYSLGITVIRLSTGLQVISTWNGGGNTDVTRTAADTTGNTSTLTAFDQFSFYINGGTGAINNLTLTGLNVTVSAVPEPSTCAALVGAAGLAFAAARRRRS